MKWLSRELIRGPYLCLCTSEAEFHRAMGALKVSREKRPLWISPGADATTHTYDNAAGHVACIVCIKADKGKTGIQIAAALVHEAVHVWQKHRAAIGEMAPSSEFEAYSVQAIAQRLMQAYADRGARK